jgi:putative ABC transport system ATP-binding protein
MGDDGSVQSVGVDVRVHGLSHSFRSPAGDLVVLSDVDVEVPAGKFCTLEGPSGAGKSTLLGLLGGLRRPPPGTVVVGDMDVGALGSTELAVYRRSTVGFVFQHFGLLEALTAQENVEFALTLAGAGRRRRHRRARELLEAVGLTARSRHRPAQLSGGERQRVGIARSLANEPRLLLVDEPTGNLDDSTSRLIVDLLVGLQAERGFTMVLVTHDASIADRAPVHLHLRGGRLVPA